jgi:hypothetical protein
VSTPPAFCLRRVSTFVEIPLTISTSVEQAARVNRPARLRCRAVFPRRLPLCLLPDGSPHHAVKCFSLFQRARSVPTSPTSASNVWSPSGCCYGVDQAEDKGDYVKKCGQSFWSFISGDDELFTAIIEPLGHKAKERNEAFQEEYGKVFNRFTKEFISEFCQVDCGIDWKKLVRFNSGRLCEATR